MDKLYLNWQVGHSTKCNVNPESFVSATVPGAVQLDWAKAHNWPDYWYGANFKDYDWMEDCFWHYKAQINPPLLKEDQSLWLYCGGVDYRYDVLLDGKLIYSYEGMFTPFELDISNAHENSTIEIIVYPAPKTCDSPQDRRQATQSCKPAVSYGWDWHPRLIPLGIWQETYIVVKSQPYIEEFETLYDLNDSLDMATISVFTKLSKGIGSAIWQLIDPKGYIVEDEKFSVPCKLHHQYSLPNPALWWPNGYGEQPLYTSLLMSYDAEGNLVSQSSHKIGFKTASLDMYDGAWNEPVEFPKTRSNPPIKLTINGKHVFAKGSNWVNPSIFPGTISRETYEPLLNYAKNAHMNIMRVWGGGIINKSSFFDLCDELGIMVWQEFPLACGNYIGTPEYLKVLDNESKSIIKSLRSRASMTLWCGGNELFNGWSQMTDQSFALRLLNRNCYDLDPYKPYLPTSPVMGMAHGCYLFQYPDGREVFEVMPKAHNTAYTEFGVPSIASLETLRLFMPEDALFPPEENEYWTEHHAYHAWDTNDTDHWICTTILKQYFGEPENIGQLIDQSQWLQSEGYKCIFEEARRQKPRCSMAINWCYAEPWPAAANNSLISWPNTPKPALYEVGNSLRPVIGSLAIPKFSWVEGETLEADMWLLNDTHEAIMASKLTAYLNIGSKKIKLLDWEIDEISPDCNSKGPTLRCVLPSVDTDRLILTICDENDVSRNSSYTLKYQPKQCFKRKDEPLTLNT